LANLAVPVLDLNHRAFVDKETGQADRLAQETAAVFAEIHDDGVDALLLEFAKDAADVVRRGTGVGGAGPEGVGVRIERGQLDDADAVLRRVRRSALWGFKDFALRRPVGQLDLLAGEDVDD